MFEIRLFDRKCFVKRVRNECFLLVCFFFETTPSLEFGVVKRLINFNERVYVYIFLLERGHFVEMKRSREKIENYWRLSAKKPLTGRTRKKTISIDKRLITCFFFFLMRNKSWLRPIRDFFSNLTTTSRTRPDGRTRRNAPLTRSFFDDRPRRRVGRARQDAKRTFRTPPPGRHRMNVTTRRGKCVPTASAARLHRGGAATVRFIVRGQGRVC